MQTVRHPSAGRLQGKEAVLSPQRQASWKKKRRLAVVHPLRHRAHTPWQENKASGWQRGQTGIRVGTPLRASSGRSGRDGGRHSACNGADPWGTLAQLWLVCSRWPC